MSQEKARPVSCVANERQLADDVLMYAQDADGLLSPAAIDNLPNPAGPPVL